MLFPRNYQHLVGMAKSNGHALMGLFLSLYVFASAAELPNFPPRPIYPNIGPMLVDWPLPKVGTKGGLIHLECYNELDASFIDPHLLFRLTLDQRPGEACLLRIPTQSRVKLEQLHFSNENTTVTVLAGSSPVYLPLKTANVRKGDSANYGPWHIPCKSAYLVVRQDGPQYGQSQEWVEFRLSHETPEDLESGWDTADCSADAKNYAVEYEPFMEEEGVDG